MRPESDIASVSPVGATQSIAGRRRERRVSLAASMFLSLRVLCAAQGIDPDLSEQTVEHFHSGQLYLTNGESAKAVEEFKQVLTWNPHLVEAEVNLGLAYQSMYEYELAARHLSAALSQRPGMAGPALIAGMDYLKLGNGARALPYLERSMKIDPANREVRRAMASAYVSQGDLRDAAQQFREAAALDPDRPESLFRLGHDYLGLSARLAYRGARVYRESGWGHRFIGDLLAQRELWDSAAVEYRKALSLDARQLGLHAALGQALLQRGKLEDAAAEFHRELQMDPLSEVSWLGLAEEHLASDRMGEAIEAVDEVWRVSPEFVTAQPEFPIVDIPRERARQWIERLQSQPASVAREFLVASLYEGWDRNEAEAHWAIVQDRFNALRKNPPSGAANTSAPCQMHRFAACLQSFDSLKALTASQWLIRGKTQYALRQFDRAADSLSRVTGVSSDNVEASYWLALSYHNLGAQAYEQLEEVFPNAWRTHQLRAEGHALSGDLDAALKELQSALELSPDNAELREAIGEVYLDKDTDDDARRELNAALALDPTRTHALCLLARSYLRGRDNDKAVPFLKQALRLQPDLAEASNLLGTAYVRLGQFADAVPHLKQAAALDYYGNVDYQLFVAYRKLGQSKLAQEALKRSQELRQSALQENEAAVMGGVQRMEGDPQ